MRATRTAAFLLLACAAVAAGAADNAPPASPPERPGERELAAGRRAIQAKAWPEAIRQLEQAAARQPSNPDVHNLLGYAERNRGNLDAAFGHYERALQLDPKHRGAHEYVGETYLLAGKLPQAEEHLAALGKLCGPSCEEYQDLARSVAEYRRKKGVPGR
jgi:Flp pilus assembly protein TadD